MALGEGDGAEDKGGLKARVAQLPVLATHRQRVKKGFIKASL